MFANLPLIVMKAPSGRFIYRGRIPGILGTEHPATTSAVLGQRAFRNATGTLVELQFPTFETADLAVSYATDRGCAVAQVCL